MSQKEEQRRLGDIRSVLIVDDEVVVSTAVRAVLRRAGVDRVDCAESGARALELLEGNAYDVILLDVQFEGDWRGVLASARRHHEPPAVLMLSGRADVRTAVDAIKLGAVDFLEKPVLAGELIARLRNLSSWPSGALSSPGPDRGEAPSSTREFRSRAMEVPLALADRVAATPASSALLVGESGVGKEVLATRIHERSARKGRPFVRVNLAAIPESVIEAELFGATRGAYTDAKQDRLGHLASADGGTILLDEIGEFCIDLQAKLLRAIEERRFFAVGSDRERRVDVRILAATNRPPEELVASRVLRADLFYRLGVVIRVPPLRERREEIAPLAESFVARFCREFGRPPSVLTGEASAKLVSYAWPGNIRELRTVIERAVMMADGAAITPAMIDVAEGPPGSGSPVDLHALREQSVGELEREHILRVLAMAKDSRSRAASMLGVSRSTLYEKLKRYGIG